MSLVGLMVRQEIPNLLTWVRFLHRAQGDIMPVHRTYTDSGQPAYQWGQSGHKYPYTAGSEASRRRAKAKAEAQGRAARANGYTGK